MGLPDGRIDTEGRYTAVAGRTGAQARQWYLRHATAFLSTGSKGRAALLAEGVPEARAFEVPFVVDVDWIASAVQGASSSRATVRGRLGVPDTAWLLLFIGRMLRRKGVDLPIEAVARLASPRGTS